MHICVRTGLRKHCFSLATCSPRLCLLHRTCSNIRAILWHTYLSHDHAICTKLTALVCKQNDSTFLACICLGTLALSWILCRKESISFCDTESSSKCSLSWFGLRQSSDNMDVCNLAHRSHILMQRVRIVPENAVNTPGLLLETEHSPTSPFGGEMALKHENSKFPRMRNHLIL